MLVAPHLLQHYDSRLLVITGYLAQLLYAVAGDPDATLESQLDEYRKGVLLLLNQYGKEERNRALQSRQSKPQTSELWSGVARDLSPVDRIAFGLYLLYLLDGSAHADHALILAGMADAVQALGKMAKPTGMFRSWSQPTDHDRQISLVVMATAAVSAYTNTGLLASRTSSEAIHRAIELLQQHGTDSSNPALMFMVNQMNRADLTSAALMATAPWPEHSELSSFLALRMESLLAQRPLPPEQHGEA